MAKRLEGSVLSDKMQKTVVIGVEMIKTHPLYKKRLRRQVRFYAQNDLGAKEGERVVIESTRPFSKLKRWRVIKKLEIRD